MYISIAVINKHSLFNFNKDNNKELRLCNFCSEISGLEKDFFIGRQ